MRIVAGRLRGRRLRVPPGIRPTTERIREALFSIIAAEDRRVLDLFAGSGAIGIEALSRGARSATFVERDAAACRALEANLRLVEPWGSVALHRCDAWTALRRLAGPFDLAFVDPPYGSAAVEGVHSALGALMAEGALLVIELGSRQPPPPCPSAWERLTVRVYGASAIVVDRVP